MSKIRLLINTTLLLPALILFVALPYKVEIMQIWYSYRDPDNVNEVALGMYLLYQSIVQGIT